MVLVKNRELKPEEELYLRALLAPWQVNDQRFTADSTHGPEKERISLKLTREKNTDVHRLQREDGYLDSMPRGVTFREPISMAKAMPGASRSITSLVAWNTISQSLSAPGLPNACLKLQLLLPYLFFL